MSALRLLAMVVVVLGLAGCGSEPISYQSVSEMRTKLAAEGIACDDGSWSIVGGSGPVQESAMCMYEGSLLGLMIYSDMEAAESDMRTSAYTSEADSISYVVGENWTASIAYDNEEILQQALGGRIEVFTPDDATEEDIAALEDVGMTVEEWEMSQRPSQPTADYFLTGSEQRIVSDIRTWSANQPYNAVDQMTDQRLLEEANGLYRAFMVEDWSRDDIAAFYYQDGWSSQDAEAMQVLLDITISHVGAG